MLLLYVFALIMWGLPLGAGELSIDSLLTEQRKLSAQHDSLKIEQVRLASQADSIGVRIYNLKAMNSEVEELQEALVASLDLVAHLVQVDDQLEQLVADEDSLKEQLGLAYEWEIGRLIQQLDQSFDDKLLARLDRLQKARGALGDQSNPMWMRYDEEMTIGPEDGPEEIRQKIKWMEDMADRLKIDYAKVERRRGQLEEEERLRDRVRSFTSQINFFDEHLPEGRVLRQVSLAGVSQVEDAIANVDAAVEPPTERVADGLAPVDEVVFVDEVETELQEGVEALSLVAQEGSETAEGQMGEGDVSLELHRLKARQLELRQIQSVLQERIGTFHMHLKDLLEGE